MCLSWVRRDILEGPPLKLGWLVAMGCMARAVLIGYPVYRYSISPSSL